MKQKLFFIVILMLVILIFSNCAKKDDWPVLKGPYLGQKPPGMTPEIFAPGILTTQNTEWAPTFTPLANECYYSVLTSDDALKIVYMKNQDEIWQPPELVSFSSPYNDADPFLSPGGKRLFFWSNRPETVSEEVKNHSDIWMVERGEVGWGDPQLLDSLINTQFWQIYPAVSVNENLYFTSYDENSVGGLDIYMSEFIDGKYNEPVNLGASVNSPHLDEEAYIAPDESYIIFCSDRHAPKSGNWDLYISFRNKKGGWATAKSMGDEINSPALDQTPIVSNDGKYLFFASRRRKPINYHDERITYKTILEALNNPQNGSPDVYWVDAKMIEELKPEELK